MFGTKCGLGVCIGSNFSINFILANIMFYSQFFPVYVVLFKCLYCGA